MAGLSGFFKRLDGLYETSSDEIEEIEEEEIEEEEVDDDEIDDTDDTDDAEELEETDEAVDVEETSAKLSKVEILKNHYRDELDSLVEFNKSCDDSELRRCLNLGYKILDTDEFGVDEITAISEALEKAENRKKIILEKEEMDDWLNREGEEMIRKAKAKKAAAAASGTLQFEEVKKPQPVVVRKPQPPVVQEQPQVPQPAIVPQEPQTKTQQSQPADEQTQVSQTKKKRKQVKREQKQGDDPRLEMIQQLSSSKPNDVKLASLFLQYLGLSGTPEKLVGELLAGDTNDFFALASEYARECGKLSFGVVEATSFEDLVILPVLSDDERREGFWVDQRLLTDVAIDPRTGGAVRFGTLYPEQYRQLTKKDPVNIDPRDVILVTVADGKIVGETNLWDYVSAGAASNKNS